MMTCLIGDSVLTASSAKPAAGAARPTVTAAIENDTAAPIRAALTPHFLRLRAEPCMSHPPSWLVKTWRLALDCLRTVKVRCQLAARPLGGCAAMRPDCPDAAD